MKKKVKASCHHESGDGCTKRVSLRGREERMRAKRTKRSAAVDGGGGSGYRLVLWRPLFRDCYHTSLCA